MAGVLYGVSVGPGDPELITFKAVRLIEKCGVIAVPRTKGENMLALSIAEQAADITGRTIVPLDFTMSRDKDVLRRSHEDIAQKLMGYLESEDVAMLSLGDISVYSTFSYIAEIVRQNGYSAEICPGVTSFCAAAAAAGRPLVTGNDSLTILPENNDEFMLKMAQNGTKVIMKSRKSAEKIKSVLAENGLTDKTYAVELCGMKNQKIYSDINELTEDCSYFTTIIAGE